MKSKFIHILSYSTALLGFAIYSQPALAQYCPCYTASSVNNNNNCGVEAVNGTNPSQQEWNAIFDLVAQGPSVWGNKGPTVSDIGQGCGVPEPYHVVPARFPCELLKGIAMQESGWRQFCVPTTPSDQVGGPSRTIISFDCGYGIGQVTSGMHNGENPDFDRNLVAGDPTYNLATGTRILASKWIATECVGDNQPSIIEHWYAAAWAYNGLAYVNNPNNPNYNANRGVWNPQVGGGAPYQEKVFGWIENPPFADWESTALAYPNPGDIGNNPNQFPNAPPQLPEPDCASPTNCANTRTTHTTICNGQTGTGGAGGMGQGGSATGSGGQSSGSGGGNPVGSGGAGTGAGNGSGGGNANGGQNPDDGGGCGCRVGSQTDTNESITIGLLLLIAGSYTARRRKTARNNR